VKEKTPPPQSGLVQLVSIARVRNLSGYVALARPLPNHFTSGGGVNQVPCAILVWGGASVRRLKELVMSGITVQKIGLVPEPAASSSAEIVSSRDMFLSATTRTLMPFLP
jgi:hypothetical protein